MSVHCRKFAGKTRDHAPSKTQGLKRGDSKAGSAAKESKARARVIRSFTALKLNQVRGVTADKLFN